LSAVQTEPALLEIDQQHQRCGKWENVGFWNSVNSIHFWESGIFVAKTWTSNLESV
jgi:hypothetical protein